MARHDLRCVRCGAIHPDVDIPVTVGARKYCATGAHRCHHIVNTHYVCMGELEPLPAIRISLFSDADSHGGRTDFAKFTLPVEDPGAPGGFREETIGSLADIRRLERESEQREANGEGRRMVWRDYSQDGSNRDRHTLGADPSRRPSKTFLNGTPVQIRRGDPVIADHGTIEASD